VVGCGLTGDLAAHAEKSGWYCEIFPLVIEPSLFVMALLLATLSGLVAAVAPALRAARLDPVVAIRG
jgi:ABC-type lipoprotein release transport system permease subunit